MNTDKMLPLFGVILPVAVFCFTVAVSYYCGKASAKQEQTNEGLKERIDYWRLKNAMINIGLEDIVELYPFRSRFIWAKEKVMKTEELNYLQKGMP